MNEYLTEKQEAVLKFIEEYQLSNGKSPTIKEMKEYFGVTSDNSILKHLKGLQEKGYIEKDDTPRGIKLLGSVESKLKSEEVFSIPLLGFIPAGGPVLSEQYIERWMNIGSDLLNSKHEHFMLRVTGESMIDAGIFEGDMVLVDINKKPKNNDIVVALVDNENTLKRYIVNEGKAYLKAENKNFKNIYPINELTIQGVITSLIRQFS